MKDKTQTEDDAVNKKPETLTGLHDNWLPVTPDSPPRKGGSSAEVFPVECGRYLWDDEPVTVYCQDDELIGETLTECDTVKKLDLIFRIENAMQHQITADSPWQRVGDCYKENCESASHNAAA